MKFEYSDGGRSAAGYSGNASDCVCRAIAIAAELPYQQVYDAIAKGCGEQRQSKRSRKLGKSARNGVYTSRKWFKDYMAALGWKWTPTMGIGTGCKVHLTDGELPSGRLIVAVSRHYTCVIDGVVHDTHDPQRDVATFEPDNGGELKAGEQRNQNGIFHISKRCVYGYWSKAMETGILTEQ